MQTYCPAPPPPRTAVKVSATIFGPFYFGRSGVTDIPYGKPERCPGVAVLVEGALLTAVVSNAPYILHYEWAPHFFMPWAMTLLFVHAASWR